LLIRPTRPWAVTLAGRDADRDAANRLRPVWVGLREILDDDRVASVGDGVVQVGGGLREFVEHAL
jgi:hypothetical protein